MVTGYSYSVPVLVLVLVPITNSQSLLRGRPRENESTQVARGEVAVIADHHASPEQARDVSVRQSIHDILCREAFSRVRGRCRIDPRITIEFRRLPIRMLVYEHRAAMARQLNQDIPANSIRALVEPRGFLGHWIGFD